MSQAAKRLIPDNLRPLAAAQAAIAAKRIIPTALRPGMAIRADGGAGAARPSEPSMAEVTALVTSLNTAFEQFKAKRDEEIADLKKKGSADVVTSEHVERINAHMTRSEADLKAIQARLTALAIGAGNDNRRGNTPEAIEHANAFNRFLRKGVEAGLQELQVKAALTTDKEEDGGYTVPDELDRNISRVQLATSAMRRLATVRPVGVATVKNLHNVGGANGGWVSEKGARPETNTPKLVEQAFPTFELYAMPAATGVMLDDSFLNTEGWLADEVGFAFTDLEGSAFVVGDGVNMPRGFTTYTMVANASWAWGKVGFIKTGVNGDFVATAAATNPYDNLVDLLHALKPQYRNSAAFVCSDPTLAKIRKIKANDGTYVYLPPTAEMGSTILGKAVETDDYMPAIANGNDAVWCGDFKRAYLITDRVGVRVLRDPYSQKPYVLFYTTKRVGGGVKDFEAIKALRFSA